MPQTKMCKNQKCNSTFTVEFRNQEYCKSCLNPDLKETKEIKDKEDGRK